LECVQNSFFKCLSPAQANTGGGTAAVSGYANTAVAQPDDEDPAGEAIGAFANLTTATTVDRGIVTNLIEANLCFKNNLKTDHKL
jgi:hypothetical protein